MKKRVLITGSNGVLGKNLVRYLKNNYDDFFELVLFDLAHDQDFFTQFETFTGDLRDPNILKQAVEEVEIVIHAASASPSYPDTEVYDIIINGSKNLFEVTFNHEKVSRLIYLSSTSVYGVPQKTPLYETDAVMPYDPYNKSKMAVEELCSTWRKKGKCVTILRPRSFIGPGRLGTFAILYEWASEGHHFPMIGSGKNLYQLLDVEDLCQAIYLAMVGEREQVNDLFNIGAAEFASIKEDYQAVLEAAGFYKKIISLPAKPMFLILNILEKLKLSPFYKRLYLKLNKDYYVSIDKAKAKLGYAPRYSNQAALLRNYYWYLQEKERLGKANGAGNNATWNQGILRLGKLFF